MHLLPEQVAFEVLSDPASQTPAVGWVCDFFLQPPDESPSVFEDASVRSDPDLEDATFLPLVEAEQKKADQVSVATQSNDATMSVCFLVCLVGKKSNSVSVDARC